MENAPARCLVIVTGLPASGKTLLAAELARVLDVALLAKDAFKESLFDALGSGDAAHSRRLSDASFALQFLVAGQLLAAGRDVLLEGNFRPGEHEQPLRPLVRQGARVAQVLCRVDEPLRRQRLDRRRQEASRHPGHRDGERAVAPVADGFLDLEGPRWLHSGQASRSARRALAEALTRWQEAPEGAVAALPGGMRD
jgi:predicted kinase